MGDKSVDNPRQKLGKRGERVAEKYLRGKGYEILDRNFRLRAGELDLVAKDGDTLVFVEVRTTSAIEQGGPLATVTRKKQRRVIRVAMLYLQVKGISDDTCCRFDVIGLVQVEDDRLEVEHVIDAFEM